MLDRPSPSYKVGPVKSNTNRSWGHRCRVSSRSIVFRLPLVGPTNHRQLPWRSNYRGFSKPPPPPGRNFPLPGSYMDFARRDSSHSLPHLTPPPKMSTRTWSISSSMVPRDTKSSAVVKVNSRSSPKLVAATFLIPHWSENPTSITAAAPCSCIGLESLFVIFPTTATTVKYGNKASRVASPPVYKIYTPFKPAALWYSPLDLRPPS